MFSYDLSFQYGQFPLIIDVSNIILTTGTGVKWSFGDGEVTGTFGTNTPYSHEYKNAGTYYVTGQELDQNGNIVSSLIKEVKVLDKSIATIGVGGNCAERCNLVYGGSTEQGLGWSDDGDDGDMWADTKGSIVNVFDTNGDGMEVVFDSRTGLPFVADPRKAFGGSIILDAWKDKIDPLLPNSGIPITTRVKLQEFIGASETFQQSMSDISLFFSPIYKENQGKDGYNSDGLLSDMKINIELYRDDLLDKKASSKDIPMKTELYFDRNIVGNVLQLAFETTEAEFRFTRGECFLSDYDKARSPFQVRKNDSGDEFSGMTEKDYQERIADVADLWISRGTPIINRITKEVVLDLVVGSGLGADGQEGSFFTCNQNVVLPNGLSASLMVICNKDSNVFQNQTTTLYGEVVSGWYLHYINSGVTGGLELISGNKYFDLRILTNNVNNDILEYYRNDVAQNSANSNCPRY